MFYFFFFHIVREVGKIRTRRVIILFIYEPSWFLELIKIKLLIVILFKFWPFGYVIKLTLYFNIWRRGLKFKFIAVCVCLFKYQIHYRSVSPENLSTVSFHIHHFLKLLFLLRFIPHFPCFPVSTPDSFQNYLKLHIHIQHLRSQFYFRCSITWVSMNWIIGMWCNPCWVEYH